MKVKKPRAKLSQLSAPTVEKVSPPVTQTTPVPSSALAPQGTIYNPAGVGDGNAAKIWELVRQNPKLRQYAAYLLNAFVNHEHGLNELTLSQDLLAGLDRSNPIGAYALRWLFEPVFLKMRETSNLFGINCDIRHMTPAAENERIKEHDRIIGLFPYLDDSEITEIIWRGWDEFCGKVPFYTLRRHEMFAVENLQKVFGVSFKQGPLLDERDRMKYAGPLRINTGAFNLDTPWCDAPELFRNHFAWLWCHFDFSAKSPFTGDRKYLPRPEAACWLVNQIADQPGNTYQLDLARSEQVRYYAYNCEIFAFPKLIYSDPDIGKTLKAISDRLNSAVSLHERIVSKAKFNSLLGSPAEWKVFAFCRPLISYQVQNEKLQSSGAEYKSAETEIKAAVKKWRQTELKDCGKKLSMTSSTRPLRLKRNQTHLTKRYLKMEKLMFSVFPKLDIELLVKHSLG